MTDGQNSDENEKLSESEDRYDKARKMLGGIPMGGHIDIVRTKPNWCKGYLDRIDANPDEPINLDDLRDEYGGKTLNLRAYDPDNKYLGSATIHFPDPPKKDGKRISYDDSEDAEVERSKRQDSGGNVELVKLLMQQQNQMMAQMATVFNAQLQAAQKAQATGAAAVDPLGQIERIGDTLERLEGLKGKIGGGGDATGGLNLQKGMDALIELFAGKQRHEMDLELAKMQRIPQNQQPNRDPLPLPARAAAMPTPTAAAMPTPNPAGMGMPTPNPAGMGMPTPTAAAMPTPNPAGMGMPTPTAAISPQDMDDAALLMAVASRFSTMDKAAQGQAVHALLSMVDPDVLEGLGDDGNDNDLVVTEKI